MHRFILNAKKGEEVDHLNGDGLDNQRSNLRNCTHAQNQFNRKIQKNNTSGFKGVCRQNGRWAAQIHKNGKRTFLGLFSSPEEASEAYEKAAEKLYGEFRRLNCSGK